MAGGTFGLRCSSCPCSGSSRVLQVDDFLQHKLSWSCQGTTRSSPNHATSKSVRPSSPTLSLGPMDTGSSLNMQQVGRCSITLLVLYFTNLSLGHDAMMPSQPAVALNQETS